MAELKIKVTRPVTDGIINLKVQAVDVETDTVEWEYTRRFDMNEVGYGDLGPLAQTALSEGFGKALRESTAGQFDKSDSQKRVDSRLSAWEGGEWGSSAEGGEAVAFSTGAAESVALAAAYPDKFRNAGEASGFLNARLDALLKAPFASLDEKLRAKARRKFSEELVGKDARYATAFAGEVAERQRAAAERKAARIRAAAQAAPAGSLFDE